MDNNVKNSIINSNYKSNINLKKKNNLDESSKTSINERLNNNGDLNKYLFLLSINSPARGLSLNILSQRYPSSINGNRIGNRIFLLYLSPEIPNISAP